MRKIYIIATVLVLFTSCSKKFEYQSQVNLYLKEVQDLSINSEAILILFSGGCGTCDERTKELIKRFNDCPNFQQIDKFVILPNKYKMHVSYFEINGFNVLIDNNFQTSRYGIDFDKNLLIHYKSANTVKYWQWLYMEYFYEISKEYGFEGI